MSKRFPMKILLLNFPDNGHCNNYTPFPIYIYTLLINSGSVFINSFSAIKFYKKNNDVVVQLFFFSFFLPKGLVLSWAKKGIVRNCGNLERSTLPRSKQNIHVPVAKISRTIV